MDKLFFERCRTLFEGVAGPVVESAVDPPFLDEAGRIVAFQGRDCVDDRGPNVSKLAIIDGHAALPAFVDQATVLLSGWKLGYLDGDHELAAFGAMIGKVSFEPPMLSWRAVGGIGDNGFDDDFRFCYRYTVVGWSHDAISARAVESAAADICDLEGLSPFSQKSSYMFRPTFGFTAFSDRPGVAVVPRGFVLGHREFNLRKAGYKLNQPSPFVERLHEYSNEGMLQRPVADASIVDDGAVTWGSVGVAYDDFVRRSVMNDAVGLVAGPAVGIVDSPVLPRAGVEPGDLRGVGRSETVAPAVIRHVPFQYAIPILSGWDLVYDDGDEHVAAMGMSIEHVVYDRDTGPLGTLHYDVRFALHDENQDNAYSARAAVAILGFDGTGTPDLIPKQDPSHFVPCDRDQDDKLVFTIRNVGLGRAGPSVTRIAFPTTHTNDVLVDTPPIPAGLSVVLAGVPIPRGCANPCNGGIVADDQNQVAEGPGERNNAAAISCRP